MSLFGKLLLTPTIVYWVPPNSLWIQELGTTHWRSHNMNLFLFIFSTLFYDIIKHLYIAHGLVNLYVLLKFLDIPETCTNDFLPQSLWVIKSKFCNKYR